MKHVFRCVLLAVLLLPEIIRAQPARARKGTFDLRNWDFQTKGPVNLNGEWDFFMSQLVDPKEFRSPSLLTQDYISFPATWNEYSNTRRPGDGYATYHLTLLIHAPKRLALELPHFYSSYTLFINEKVVAKNGIVGASEKTSRPQWLPQTITYQASSDTLELVIQVSNFHHAKGGIREPIKLGTPEHLDFKRQISRASNLIMFASLSVLGVIFIFVFLFSKNENSILYFSALCFTWALRSLYSNQYIANSFLPNFPWELCVKIEYITLYLTMIWGILFLSNIFSNDINNVFKYFFCFCNLLFVAVTVFTPASVYTQFLPVYLSFCVFLLIYVIYVLIRAVVYEREGVWWLVTGLFLGVILFSYDLISYEGFATFNPVIVNVGYFTMFILMGLCLMYQLGLLKRSNSQTNMLTYEDLYGTKKQ